MLKYTLPQPVYYVEIAEAGGGTSNGTAAKNPGDVWHPYRVVQKILRMNQTVWKSLLIFTVTNPRGGFKQAVPAMGLSIKTWYEIDCICV